MVCPCRILVAATLLFVANGGIADGTEDRAAEMLTTRRLTEYEAVQYPGMYKKPDGHGVMDTAVYLKNTPDPYVCFAQKTCPDCIRHIGCYWQKEKNCTQGYVPGDLS